MDEFALRAFKVDRRRTERRLTEVIADIRVELKRVEDAIESGKPLAASRTRQVVSLAGSAAVAAGAWDVLVEWGDIFVSQGGTEMVGEVENNG